MKEVRNRLIIRPEKCTGCRICELVCSFHHNRNFNPKRARIMVLRNSEEGVYVPTVCQQCEKLPCEESCIVGAIHRDNKTGSTVIDASLCIACGKCIIACPFNGIFVDPATSRVIKCELCEGDPQCVKFCPRKAIELTAARTIESAEPKVSLKPLIQVH